MIMVDLVCDPYAW